MKNKKLIMGALIITWAALSAAAAETRLLRYPDIHKDQIAFCYGGDIYTASVNGQNVRRLTSLPGEELLPKFSPDGEQIAFTAEFEGNKEIYVMSAHGGKPRRLTFHPADEYVVDWHPDGTHILFRSNGSSFSYRFNRLHSVPVQGGLPAVLEPAEADLSSYNDQGDQIAFCRTSLETLPWKRYRGGAGPSIWTFDFKTHKSELVVDDASINHHPLWIGDAIYFVSDRGEAKEQNLWAYDCRSRAVRQLTFYKDWGVKWPSRGGGKIIYENEGRLCVYDVKTGRISAIRIEIGLPDGFLTPTVKNVQDKISSVALSPDGKKVIVGARGELFGLDPEKKITRNLTETPGVNERAAVWSPDGRSYAYISDRSGEEQIYVQSEEGGGPPVQVSRCEPSKLGGLNWSPNGNKIGYSDKRAAFYVIDLETRETRKIFFNEYFASERYVAAAWSPDSRWLAYEVGNPNWCSSIFLYSFDADRAFRVTDESSSAYNPRFDPDGRYLFWIADCAVEVADSYGDEDHHMLNPSKIVVATLQRDRLSPFSPGGGGVPGPGSPAAFPIRIDVDGLGQRITTLPVANSNYRDLTARSGRLIYRSEPDGGEPAVKIFDLAGPKESTLLNAGYAVYPAARADKLLYSGSGRVGLLDIRADQKAGDGLIDLSGLRMTVDYRQEWRQMFTDAWRIQRDFFFDEKLRGVDWEAMKRKYEVFLPDVASRRDLNSLIEDMFAELGQSHVEINGGEGPSLPVHKNGLLGIDLEFDRAHRLYRITRIYRGRNWDADRVSPLTLPGLNIKSGDYLLAIDGTPLEERVNPDSLLVDKAGENTVLTIHDKPVWAGARTMTVKPASYSARQGDLLRYNDWVLSNMDAVNRASGGKIGYLHIPDTYYPGIEAFFRYFYAQIHKEGLIVDIRFNSGGYSPYWMIERLNRSMIYYSRMPYGKAPIKEPGPGFFGLKVCLINEWAESGGENFASIFRLLKSGPLVGRRTAGNLASARDYALMDRGVVTYPAEGKKTVRGEDFVENAGVSPDIKVANRPEDFVRGIDRQLERGVQELLKQLAKTGKDH
ncbi:MAG: PDZ domain-containing protein [Candidatus Aminicenantes bacterium]|nr:PDZ domain-containing protein [Candidatus Aminicenantes bacterium]